MRGERERAQASFQIGPETFDRIQLRAVRRQINRKAASVENRFANDVHLVDVEVVHDDDVALIDPWSQALFHEAEKRSTVDGRLARHDLGFLAEPDRADERDRFPRAKRPQALHALAAKRSPVLATHSGLHKRLVDKDEAFDGEHTSGSRITRAAT